MHRLTSMRAAPRTLTLLLAGILLLAAGCTPVEKDPWAGDHGGGRPRRADDGDWPILRPDRRDPAERLGDMSLSPLRLERPRQLRPVVVLPRPSVVVNTARPSLPTFPTPSQTRRRRHRSALTATP